MSNLSHQVSQIVSTLVGLEGSSDISIIARRYPRIGPAESGVGFEEKALRFSAAEVPSDMPLPADMDEVVIRVDGELPESNCAGELRQRVNDFVTESQIGDTWDVRSRFRDAPSRQSYQFTVFTNYVPRGGPVDLA